MLNGRQKSTVAVIPRLFYFSGLQIHLNYHLAHLQRFGNIKGEAKLDARDCLSLGAVQCARVENVSGVSYSQPRLKAVSTQALA